MQGKRQQDLGFVSTMLFCKVHKSRRICEALFDVAKCQRKRFRIERYPRKATWKRERRREESQRGDEFLLVEAILCEKIWNLRNKKVFEGNVPNFETLKSCLFKNFVEHFNVRIISVRLNFINHLVGFIPCQICLYFSNQ